MLDSVSDKFSMYLQLYLDVRLELLGFKLGVVPVSVGILVLLLAFVFIRYYVLPAFLLMHRLKRVNRGLSHLKIRNDVVHSNELDAVFLSR